MLDTTSGLRLGESDIALVGKLAIAENLFLAIVTAVAALNVVGWLAPSLSGLFRGGWCPMSLEAAIASILTVASLHLSRPRYAQHIQSVSMAIALLVAFCSMRVFAGSLLYSAPHVVSGAASWVARGMSPQAAGSFVLMGVATLLIRVRGRMGLVADFATFCLLFLVSVLASGQLLGVLGMFGTVSTYFTAGQTALCLLLLASVVFFRRAENGVFSILLGHGIGSKVVRVVAPLVIVMPYFRECVRAHFINFQRMPPYYVTALLATMVMAFSIALLMYLAWRLNAMEIEIHGLSLRDPLTGLYNLRGFRLLAEQALLLARRSGQPYSVLFIDVDNLKQINDAYGHQTGSNLLAAAADLLREAFRETDVLGRMGGDEFAVAGQFSSEGVAEAAERLRHASMLYNADVEDAALKFSAGWATSDPEQHQPLADLLAKADEEMYREKRRRKAAANRPKLPSEIDPARMPLSDPSESSKLRELGRI